ncbi:protein YqhG of unknown function [Lentibacillus persicus]|uniref:Uncharacterized protein n=1 Tax=Lentibacillus persicus TaxID=640948 RepID=A0A1I1T929_9BACI|nr:YqhG family protein [Lentibacillus persicus]SFD53618.1 protein YqhG of unknown function [Lentibacillus persicus]
MEINDLHTFLYDYFTAHHCEIVLNQNGMLTVQLTEEMDRALMNRPFYWHYIKKMGHPGEPKQLTLITNPEKRDGKHEWIHYGSPRLHQIVNHLRDHEKYTKLFERVETYKNQALFPWLIANIKISYQGKQKKDEMVSIGLHLVNGTMRLKMMEELQYKELQNTISDYCYTITPMIKLHSGFKRIEKVLETYVDDQDHDWALQSQKTMAEEIDLLSHFYKNKTDEETMQKEISEIKKRYSPYIKFDVINGGLFYLAENAV